MPPLNYTNLYIFSFLSFFGATALGTFYFYGGMGDVSFVVSNAHGSVTYYLDKNRYDVYLNGLIYCITFLIVAVLFLAVIVVPSMGQIQQRMASPYSTRVPQGVGMMPQPMQGPPPQMQAQPQAMQVPPNMPQPAAAQTFQPPPGQATAGAVPEEPTKATKAPKKPALTMPSSLLDDGMDEDELGEESDNRSDDSGDADVVYGTGRITPDALVDFVHRHPDSAVKYMFNKSLDGKPLTAQEEEIYRAWQKRSLSRTKMRDYVLHIMEWKEMPNLPVHDIWSQLRDQIFELSH